MGTFELHIAALQYLAARSTEAFCLTLKSESKFSQSITTQSSSKELPC